MKDSPYIKYPLNLSQNNRTAIFYSLQMMPSYNIPELHPTTERVKLHITPCEYVGYTESQRIFRLPLTQSQINDIENMMKRGDRQVTIHLDKHQLQAIGNGIVDSAIKVGKDVVKGAVNVGKQGLKYGGKAIAETSKIAADFARKIDPENIIRVVESGKLASDIIRGSTQDNYSRNPNLGNYPSNSGGYQQSNNDFGNQGFRNDEDDDSIIIQNNHGPILMDGQKRDWGNGMPVDTTLRTVATTIDSKIKEGDPPDFTQFKTNGNGIVMFKKEPLQHQGMQYRIIDYTDISMSEKTEKIYIVIRDPFLQSALEKRIKMAKRLNWPAFGFLFNASINPIFFVHREYSFDIHRENTQRLIKRNPTVSSYFLFEDSEDMFDDASFDGTYIIQKPVTRSEYIEYFDTCEEILSEKRKVNGKHNPYIETVLIPIHDSIQIKKK